MTLSVVPYYNRPTQEGLYRHFKSIAEKVDIPMILYNVPGRTVADLAHETTIRLAQVPNEVAKEIDIRPSQNIIGTIEMQQEVAMEAPYREWARMMEAGLAGRNPY